MAYGAPQATVRTIEYEPLHVELAAEQFARHPEGGRIQQLIGDAEALVPAFSDDGYDLVFFDGFNPSVALAGQLSRVLRPGGTLPATNLNLVGTAPILDELADLDRWTAHRFGDTALAALR